MEQRTNTPSKGASRQATRMLVIRVEEVGISPHLAILHVDDTMKFIPSIHCPGVGI